MTGLEVELDTLIVLVFNVVDPVGVALLEVEDFVEVLELLELLELI